MNQTATFTLRADAHLWLRNQSYEHRDPSATLTTLLNVYYAREQVPTNPTEFTLDEIVGIYREPSRKSVRGQLLGPYTFPVQTRLTANVLTWLKDHAAALNKPMVHVVRSLIRYQIHRQTTLDAIMDQHFQDAMTYLNAHITAMVIDNPETVYQLAATLPPTEIEEH